MTRRIKETCYKGTRILIGEEKRMLINSMGFAMASIGFEEIWIPIIQAQSTFKGKVGQENNNMMYNFHDRGGRDLCLAPEYTAIVQKLARTVFKQDKDVKLFYVQECFRGEKPQEGRFRQFTQFGVEILNPSSDYTDFLIETAMRLIPLKDVHVNREVTRGLDYYKDGKGFELTYNKLGAAKQICGGGAYDGGVGFAIGVDRILEAMAPEEWLKYLDEI